MSAWQFIGIWFLGSAAFIALLCVAGRNWSNRWNREAEEDFRRKGGR